MHIGAKADLAARVSRICGAHDGQYMRTGDPRPEEPNRMGDGDVLDHGMRLLGAAKCYNITLWE